MRKFITLLGILTTLVSCGNQPVAKKNSEPYSGEEINIEISIPQNSGLAFVDYKLFNLHNDSLFVILRKPNFGRDKPAESPYKSDTLERFQIDQKYIDEALRLISKTDSLGRHTDEESYGFSGYPRFYITFSTDNRSEGGFIANRYREHIFAFIDFFNKIYPNGDVISYDKDELIASENELSD